MVELISNALELFDTCFVLRSLEETLGAMYRIKADLNHAMSLFNYWILLFSIGSE